MRREATSRGRVLPPLAWDASDLVDAFMRGARDPVNVEDGWSFAFEPWDLIPRVLVSDRGEGPSVQASFVERRDPSMVGTHMTWHRMVGSNAAAATTIHKPSYRPPGTAASGPHRTWVRSCRCNSSAFVLPFAETHRRTQSSLEPKLSLPSCIVVCAFSLPPLSLQDPLLTRICSLNPRGVPSDLRIAPRMRTAASPIPQRNPVRM